MRLRFPLYAQMAALLVLHMALLLVLLLGFFNSRFGPGWNALLQSPVGDKVETIAWMIQRETHSHSKDQWNEILEQFGQAYGVKFYLFDFTGQEQGGEPVALPDEVKTQFMAPPPPPPPEVAPGMPFGPFTAPIFFQFGAHRTQAAISEMDPRKHHPPGGPFDDGPVIIQHFHHYKPGQGPILRAGPGFPQAGAVITGFPPGPPPFEHPAPFQARPDGGPREHGQFRMFRTSQRSLVHTKNPDKFWIVVRMPVVDLEHGIVLPGALIASADNLWQTRIFFDLAPVLTGMAIVLAISIAFWCPFAYKLTKALKDMTAATNKIAEGRFDTRVREHRIDDELGALGEAVNVLADKLNTFVGDEKRFLGDIAHELCSPIARLQVALELIKSDGSEEQVKVLEDIREEVTEMSNLINELLAFSKASLRGKEIELVPIQLNELLSDVARKTCSDALVRLNVSETMKVLGDDLLLRRAFSNIFRNEVRYAAADGPIDVTATRSGHDVVITTTDSGPGVSDDIVKRLGEPFFRPEPSRSRSSGGVGLGLAIVRTCIQACNGTFSIRNRKPRGLEIEIKLAAAAADSKQV